jgi:hypothetical protein
MFTWTFPEISFIFVVHGICSVLLQLLPSVGRHCQNHATQSQHCCILLINTCHPHPPYSSLTSLPPPSQALVPLTYLLPPPLLSPSFAKLQPILNGCKLNSPHSDFCIVMSIKKKNCHESLTLFYIVWPLPWSPPFPNELTWSSYEPTWFSGADKQEIFILNELTWKLLHWSIRICVIIRQVSVRSHENYPWLV